MANEASKDLLLRLNAANKKALHDAQRAFTGGSLTRSVAKSLVDSNEYADALYKSLPVMEYRSAEVLTPLTRLGASNLRTLDMDFSDLQRLASMGLPVVWCPDKTSIQEMAALSTPSDISLDLGLRIIESSRVIVTEAKGRMTREYPGTQLFDRVVEALDAGMLEVTIPFSLAAVERVGADFLVETHGSYQRTTSSSNLVGRFRRLEVDSFEFDIAAGVALRHHLIAKAIFHIFKHSETREVETQRYVQVPSSEVNRNGFFHYLTPEVLTPANTAIAFGLLASVLVEQVHCNYSE